MFSTEGLCCCFVSVGRRVSVSPLQEPDPSGCPLSMRSAGSWWRPAGTGTLPWGRCSVSWSPACKASWSGSAAAALNRRAAASRTQTKKKHSRQTNTRVTGILIRKCFLVFMKNGDTGDTWIMFQLSSSCWIYIIYELIQVCVFYCLCFVYLYTNSTLCFCRSCHANCYLVVELLLDANVLKSSPLPVLWKKYKYIKD